MPSVDSVNGKAVTHTPGPWKAVEPLCTWISTVGDPYGHGPMHIADIRGWGHLTGAGACALNEDAAVAIQNANARLIAAAPELLETLQGVLDYLDIQLGSCEQGCDCIKHDVEAAIAKAEGR